VGGGAAGFFAAIACAETNPAARITLLEKGGAVLSKVKISGGGRCNVTHACFDPKALAGHYPRGGPALLGLFHRFQPRDTLEWFAERGVGLKTEADGRVFPVSDKSQTIIDTLTGAAREANVRVRTGVSLQSLEREGEGGFRAATGAGETLRADRLLLSTGGAPQGRSWAGSLGHTIVPPVPSLFTFTVPDERLKGLAGVSVPAGEISLEGAPFRQRGALLVTHWGLSGPAVLKLSAWAARALHEKGYRAPLRVNWLGMTEREAAKDLEARRAVEPRKTVALHGPGIPRRLWERLVRAAGLPEERRWADLTKPEARRLAEESTNGLYLPQGKSAYKEEFVTCGGVRLDEVNFKSMESRIAPGLYFAGEILDIDGETGGFNFQSAWTTGWLAGRAMGS